MKVKEKLKTTLDNKEFVLYDADKKLYYTDDKTESTDSKTVIATWLGCKESDIVPVHMQKTCHASYSGILVEPDDGTRVRVSYWRITGISLSGKPVPVPFEIRLISSAKGSHAYGYEHSEDYTPYYYVYNNGTVSHTDALKTEERLKNQKPHTVRSLSKLITTLYDWFPRTTWGILDMNSEEYKIYSDKPEKTKQILRDAGFAEKYIIYESREDMDYTVPGLLSYVINHENIHKQSRSSTKFAADLKEMPSGVKVVIEKTEKGTMFRFKKPEYMEEDIENARVFIGNDGTISQSVFKPDPEGGKSWHSVTGNPSWFYTELQRNSKDIHIDDYKDLVQYNPKYRYINEYINSNLKTLLRLHIPEKASSDSWCCNGQGLIEFLRLANKYPVIVDTLLKLGYDDIFKISHEYSPVVLNSHPNLEAGDNTLPVDDSIFTKVELKTRNVYDYADHKFIPSVPYWSYTCKEFNDDMLRSNPFGPLRKGTKFFDIIGVTKEQWRYITTAVGEKLKTEASWFNIIKEAKTWFCGDMVDTHGWYYVPEKDRTYKTLKDVPFKPFAEFVSLWLHHNATNNGGIYSWNTFLNELTGRVYSFVNRNVPLAERAECQDRYKLYKYCMKHDVNIRQYDDYLSMRNSCRIQGSRLFHEEDWPLFVPADKVQLFHDRLVELYNAADNDARRERENENQNKYDKLLPKYKKFNFELADNERCVLCPEDLMEIVVEGQRLSHCVGSYTDSVANGREVILFLRNKLTKDRSYATIDVQYNTESKLWNVRQIHTAHNGDITDDDVEFLKEWATKCGVDATTVQKHYGALCAM